MGFNYTQTECHRVSFRLMQMSPAPAFSGGDHGGITGELVGAMDLVHRMKVAIREPVGSEPRCSVGIGPIQLLAKIAGKI